MNYSYEETNYNKRSITDNVLIKVISNDYQLVVSKNPVYREAADCLKSAEEVSQSDSCPIVGREELRPVLTALRGRIPQLRARQTQTGTAVSTDRLDAVSEEDAAFQIANGSIANIAVSYGKEARAVLLSHGILPLVTEKPLPAGSFLFLENIRRTLEEGEQKVAAFLVKETLEPVSVRVDFDAKEQLESIFAD